MTTGESMGFTDGINFWCIADNINVYCFYSAQDGSHNIKGRSTKIADFPFNWGEPTITATNTFKENHIYKNKADNKYYMMVEDNNIWNLRLQLNWPSI